MQRKRIVCGLIWSMLFAGWMLIECGAQSKALTTSWTPGWRRSFPLSTLWTSASPRLPATGYIDAETDARKSGSKTKKKYKKYLLPLLVAYKLKFFTLIPVLIGGLILLTGATGLAGFFFALFAASMGLKSGKEY